MKRHLTFYVTILVFLFGIMSCSTDDGIIGTIPVVDPMDTMDNTGGDPRMYSTESHQIGKWSIDIYVPSDYDSSSQYPVIYFNDGDIFGDVFSFLTVLDAPAFLMVGISGENSRPERFLPYQDEDVADALGEYTPMAEEYSEAIIQDIIPFVESKYRVLSNKKAFFGISLGGLHATWMAINYPQVFDFIGAMSPSYWVADEAIFEEDLSDLVPQGLAAPTKLYFDRGTAEWRNHLRFVTKLKAAGLLYGQTCFYYEVPGAAHFVEDWLLRINIPFKLFLDGIEGDPTQIELRAYCALDLTNNDANTPRVNPIVFYENGIRFSAITDASYTIINGSGSIANDGTYIIDSGTSMEVTAEFLGVTSSSATLIECN